MSDPERSESVRTYAFPNLDLKVVLLIGFVHLYALGGFEGLAAFLICFSDGALFATSFAETTELKGLGLLFGEVKWQIFAAAVVMYFVCHLSTRVYLHSYLTHDAMELPLWLRIILVIISAAVAQGPAYVWAAMHLAHHKMEDRWGDLHSPIVGCYRVMREEMTFQMKVLALLHSHMGWVFLKRSYRVREIAKFRNRRNAEKYKEVIWQHKYYWILMPAMAFGLPTLIGWMFGDALQGFLVIGVLRLFFQYHFTWIVNSLGHLIGDQIDSYATNFASFSQSGKVTFVLLLPTLLTFAVLTVGEMWHAFHHQSPRDWRLGQEWWQLDPGAWVIIGFRKAEWATNLTNRQSRPRSPHEGVVFGGTT